MLGNFYAISNLVVAVIIQLLGLFVFFQNREKFVNRIFLIFCVVSSLWMYSLFFLYYLGTNYQNAIFWSKSIYIGACFNSVLSYHFAIAFLDIKKRKWILYLFYGLSGLFLYLVYSDKLLNGLYHYAWGYFPRYGKYHPIYMIYKSFESIYTLSLLYDKYKSRFFMTSQQYQRLKYVFLAWIIGHFSLANYLPTYGITVFPIGNFCFAVLVILLTYAIVRHQLMEIEVIIKKTLVFAGLFASIFALLVLPTLVIQELIASQMGRGARVVGLTISAILIVLVSRRLENFLIRITDKYLFQKKYDYKELLKTFTTEVLTVLDIDRLVQLTTTKLTDIMKVQSCGVLLLDEMKNEYKLVASKGIEDISVVLTRDNTLTTFLDRTKGYLSTKHQGQDSPLPKRIIDDMNKLKLELAIPLIIHDEMIGVLTLGKKKSDEDYAQDDMDILLPLSRTLAIAISNARVLDELSKTQAEAAQREKMAVIGTLSAGINHEICNPLGIARGQCEAFLLNIRDGLYKNKTEKELLQKAQEIMNKVIHETDRATTITKRLSSFAKPSKGLYTEDVDIKDAVDEVLALVGYEMRLEKIEVANEVPADFPHVMGDKKQIQEVFFNLIRNAAQAIHEKGRIAVKVHQNEDRIYVDIEDTGHGISEDKIGQIFNPFYTTKDPGKGTGLGLFIVRQVVERNNGRIAVRSQEGVGTTFTLDFPVAEKVKVQEVLQ